MKPPPRSSAQVLTQTSDTRKRPLRFAVLPSPKVTTTSCSSAICTTTPLGLHIMSHTTPEDSPNLRAPAGSAPSDADALTVRGVSKSFGVTQALTDVNMSLPRGSVLGLVGANGAGKSTLLKIIAGSLAPTSGEMSVFDQSVDFHSYDPREAYRQGIFIVYQEPATYTNMSVAENFAMLSGSKGFGWRRRGAAEAREALEYVFPGSRISPRANVGSLSPTDRQMVEIAMATSRREASILIMDEPTSALPTERVAQLHDCIRRRTAAGVSVLYVTHKLEEILSLSDRILALRNGKVSWEGPPGSMTHSDLVAILGSTKASDAGPERLPGATSAVAELERTAVVDGPLASEATGGDLQPLLEVTKAGAQVPVVVRPGEVIGLAGLEGAGQRDLLRGVFAASHRHRPRGDYNVRTATAYVSGDRRREGLFELWSIQENLLISAWHRYSSHGVAAIHQARSIVDRWFQELQIVAPSAASPIVSLSGGNQQKVIIGRGLASGAPLLLLDDPTRGVDIEAKTTFYSLLQSLKAENRAALFYSTEDREFAECDRVYVMAEGNVVKELVGDEITPENIVRWSFGDSDAVAGRGSEAEPRLAESAVAQAPGHRLSVGQLSSPGTLRSFLRTVALSRITLAVVLLIATAVANGILQPSTLSNNGIDLLLEPILPAVLAALSQMFIMLAGDIDVSIGASIGLANVISATVLVSHPLAGIGLLIALVAAYGVMGLIREVTGVPAIVITLGASFIWLGVGLNIQPVPGGTAPNWLENGLNATLAVIPEPLYITVAVAVAGFFLLRRSHYGVVLRGFGNNLRSFTDQGRSPLRTRLALYLMSGVCAALGGVLVTVVTTASDINASSTLTLTSIAAVVLGGAEFIGGVVEPVGAVIAAVALGLVVPLLAFLNINTSWETAVTGMILIVAMAARWAMKRAR